MKKKLLLALALVLALCVFGACDLVILNPEVTDIEIIGGFEDYFILKGTEFSKRAVYREIYDDGTQSDLNFVEERMVTYNPDQYGPQTVTVYYNSKIQKTMNICIVDVIVSNTAEFKDALANQLDGMNIGVYNGTYELQILINSNITIYGESADGVIVNVPQSEECVVVSKLAGEAFDYQGVIAIVDCTANIYNLTILGNEEILDGYNRSCRILAVAVINSTAVLENVNIIDFKFSINIMGIQNGIAVYAAATDADRALTLTGCKILNFNKAALVSRASLAYVTVDNCEIAGYGDTGIIGQNGLQIASRATVSNTLIRDLWYTAPEGLEETEACGILLVGVTASDCNFSNNTFENVECEIAEI